LCSKTWHTIVIYSFVCGNMTNSVGVVWFSPHSMGLLMTNLGRQYLLPWNIIYFLKIKCNNLKLQEGRPQQKKTCYIFNIKNIYIHKRKLNHHKKYLLHNGTKGFPSFLHLLLQKKNYFLCELPSSLSCCEPLSTSS
jgi:hypothetical protein